MKERYSLKLKLKKMCDRFGYIIKDIAKKSMLATKALGTVDIAVEFNLITIEEWEKYIDDIFQML